MCSLACAFADIGDFDASTAKLLVQGKNVLLEYQPLTPELVIKAQEDGLATLGEEGLTISQHNAVLPVLYDFALSALCIVPDQVPCSLPYSSVVLALLHTCTLAVQTKTILSTIMDLLTSALQQLAGTAC